MPFEIVEYSAEMEISGLAQCVAPHSWRFLIAAIPDGCADAFDAFEAFAPFRAVRMVESIPDSIEPRHIVIVFPQAK